jgi:hypothetical protein
MPAAERFAQLLVMKEQLDGVSLQRRRAAVSLDCAFEDWSPARVDPLQSEHHALAAQALLGG